MSLSIDQNTQGDGLGTLHVGGLHLLGLTTSAAPPSTAEYPSNGDCGIHVDTANETVTLCFNWNGNVTTRKLDTGA